MSTPARDGPAYRFLDEKRPSGEQWPAVVERAHDVLVVAGAGAGKTTTLTARYLTLLSDGLDVREIVAITFTRRAAREMRSRIRSEIARIKRDPRLDEAERRRWETHHRQMDAARISTIHALCTELLEAHPAESGVEPGFVTLTEGEALLLRAEIVDVIIDQMDADPAFDAIFALLTVKGLRRLLMTAFERRFEVAEAWSDAAEARAALALEELRDQCRAWVTDDSTFSHVRALQAAIQYAQTSPIARGDMIFSKLDAHAYLLQTSEDAVVRSQWFEAASALLEFVDKVKQVGSKENWGIHDPKSEVKRLKQSAIASLRFDIAADPHTDERLLASRPLLRRVVDHAFSLYAERKRALHALDFDDLEDNALRLLRDDNAVRDLWNRRIAALLVDEYQDSNPRQVRLFELLANRTGARFGVGDPRQSIYAFRGANPFTMEQEVERLRDGGLVATLTVTRRAHAGLVEVINRLAATLFPGEADASELRTEREHPAEPFSAPFVELLLVKGAANEGARTHAATALANRLIQLHDRGVGWNEIAVLCRDRTSILPYEDAFESAGIPYESGTGGGLRQRPEVRDVLNALVAIADPSDNLALFGLLRSPAMGLDDSQLVNLMSTGSASSRRGSRRHPPPGALWNALAQSDTPEARRATMIIERLHARAGRVSAASLLQRFLDETGYLAALALAGQTRARRNLVKLVDDALASPQVDLSAYLADLERRRDLDVREEEAPADESVAVRLMTVHAAKGLEFPVVVLGNASLQKSTRKAALYTDGEYGVLLEPDRSGVRGSTLSVDARMRAVAVDEAESKRVLYVAATRARELLIVNGACASVDGWLKHFADAFGLKDGLTNAKPANGAPVVVDAGPLLSCTVHGLDITAERVRTAVEVGSEQSAQTDNLDLRMIEPLPQPHRLPAAPSHIPQPADIRSAAPRATDPLAGRLVHEAIAAWRFPSMGDFAGWLSSRIRAARVESGRARAVERRVSTLLRRFEASALHAEIAQSKDRHSELAIVHNAAEFGRTDESGEALDEVASGEGRIDLLYRRDDGAWVVVDFKSEPVPTLATLRREVIPAHEGQIRAYGHAVRSLLGATPLLALCFLDVAGAVHTQYISLENAREM